MVTGVLGTVPFLCSEGLVQTFGRVKRSMGEEYTEHKVLGGKPVIEWISSEAASVTFSVRLDSSLGVSPILGVKQFESMLKEREAQSLVMGLEYMGRFVLTQVEENRKFFSGAGVCAVSEVQLTLKEVG